MSDEVQTPELFDALAATPDLGADWQTIDRMELAMQELPPSAHEHVHRFTPGLYVREIRMPKHMLCVSKVHRTQHPYVILEGVVTVYIPGKGRETLRAGHFGITEPGTRRLLYVHEDVRWLTFHPTEKTDLAEIEAQIIEPYVNPLLAPPPAPAALPSEVPE